jgi:hypothetical protein
VWPSRRWRIGLAWWWRGGPALRWRDGSARLESLGRSAGAAGSSASVHLRGGPGRWRGKACVRTGLRRRGVDVLPVRGRVRVGAGRRLGWRRGRRAVGVRRWLGLGLGRRRGLRRVRVGRGSGLGRRYGFCRACRPRGGVRSCRRAVASRRARGCLRPRRPRRPRQTRWLRRPGGSRPCRRATLLRCLHRLYTRPVGGGRLLVGTLRPGFGGRPRTSAARCRRLGTDAHAHIARLVLRGHKSSGRAVGRRAG